MRPVTGADQADHEHQSRRNLLLVLRHMGYIGQIVLHELLNRPQAHHDKRSGDPDPGKVGVLAGVNPQALEEVE